MSKELEPRVSGLVKLTEAVREIAAILGGPAPVQATAERVTETPLQIEP